MPHPAIKFAVLAVSLSLGAAYVWKSSKGDRPAEPPSPPPSKVAEPPGRAVTVSEEEVATHREMLLRSSKSGIIMSDDAIRSMLEEKKRAETTKEGVQAPEHLIPSSKSMDRVLGPAELKDLQGILPLFRQEDSAPPKEEAKDPPVAPEVLIPSSKASSFLIDRKDVQLLLESTAPAPKPAPEETKKE